MHTSVHVFVGDKALHIPVHLHARRQHHTTTWLIDTALGILHRSESNICSSITALDCKTMCCGQRIMPHTKLADLCVNDHLPDIEIFVSIDKFLPMTPWQKLRHCHGFRVTNTLKPPKPEEDEESSVELTDETNLTDSDDIGECEICGQFEADICSVYVDLTNAGIIDKSDIDIVVKDEHHIDFEDICIRQVTITGTFNQWKERVPLKMKSIRNILHYVKTVDVPMNEEFKFDVSCEIRDDRVEISLEPQSEDGKVTKVAEKLPTNTSTRCQSDYQSQSGANTANESKVGLIKANTDRNQTSWEHANARSEIIEFINGFTTDPFHQHAENVGDPKSLRRQFAELIHDAHLKTLMVQMNETSPHDAGELILPHFHDFNRLWYAMKAAHGMEENEMKISQIHTVISKVLPPKGDIHILEGFKLIKSAMGKQEKTTLQFAEWIALIVYLAKEVPSSSAGSLNGKLKGMLSTLCDRYLVYSEENRQRAAMMLYDGEWKLYNPMRKVLQKPLDRLTARCCLQGEKAVISVMEWTKFTKTVDLKMDIEPEPVTLKKLSQTDWIALFFEAQNVMNRSAVELDELAGAEFVDLIGKVASAVLPMDDFNFKQKKVDSMLTITRQIADQIGDIVNV